MFIRQQTITWTNDNQIDWYMHNRDLFSEVIDAEWPTMLVFAYYQWVYWEPFSVEFESKHTILSRKQVVENIHKMVAILYWTCIWYKGGEKSYT